MITRNFRASILIVSLLLSSQLISPADAALYHYQQQPLAPQELGPTSSYQASQDHSNPVQNQEPPAASGGANVLPTNQLGAGSSSINQRSSDSNGPLFRFNGLHLNSTTVRLVWSLYNNFHVDSFDIYYGPIPDAPHLFSVKQLNGTTRDYTISQLQPDTLYQFQLHGYLNENLAFKPGLVAVKTQPLVNPNIANIKDSQQTGMGGKQLMDFTFTNNIMPLGVKAEAKSNQSIQLSWTEPDRPASIRNYVKVNVIRYCLNPSLTVSQSFAQPTSAVNESNQIQAQQSPQYHYLNITNARESRVIVQKLRPATEYAFAVKTIYYLPDMKKIILQSSFSMDTLAKTFDLEPSAPRNFLIKPQIIPIQLNDTSSANPTTINDIKLELSWLPPESPNGQLKGYLILYAHDLDLPDEKWSRIEIKEISTNSWYVSNLRPGVSYYFKMRALNQRGYSQDSETRSYIAPINQQLNPNVNNLMTQAAIPPNNKLLLIIICMVSVLFVLFLLVSKLACCTSSSHHRNRKARKGSLTRNSGNLVKSKGDGIGNQGQIAGLNESTKLNGFATINSSSTVAARVGTLARRREIANHNNNSKQDFWISAMDQQPSDMKSNLPSEKSNNDLNMAMVSIQRESPQFSTTTQLAPALPDYRFTTQANADGTTLMQQQQQQSHYHPGQFSINSQLGFDQMDNATASALMTLSKRQQQQMQKYQIQFATTTGINNGAASNLNGQPGMANHQAPSPHQQPPPPPPLNIEQQHNQQQQQALYGINLANTRSLRLHRPTLYDPVSGSFVQSMLEGGPPQYNSHLHPVSSATSTATTMANSLNNSFSQASNTLQYHPHQSSTLLSRRSTNTLRSFQTSNLNNQATYGQLGPINSFNHSHHQPPAPPSIAGIAGNAANNIQQQQQPQQLLQSHQAVINQLNNSTYPSLPLKHVSTVRPQIMSSLDDQIEMELAEKQAEQQQQHDQQQQQQQQQ